MCILYLIRYRITFDSRHVIYRKDLVKFVILVEIFFLHFCLFHVRPLYYSVCVE